MDNSYERVLCKSSISNSEIHIGDKYFNGNGVFYTENKTAINDKGRYPVDSLIKKEPTLSMLGRIVVSAVSFAADFITVWLALETGFSNTGVIIAILLVFTGMGLISLSSMLILWLSGRLSNLRRIGYNVYRIRARKCPICDTQNHDGKLHLTYNGDANRRDGEGNYIVCSNDPKNHYWYVVFPKEKKK